MNKEVLLATIQKQHKISSSFVQEKRQIFRENHMLYNYQRRTRDLVGDPTVYTTMGVLLGVTLLDQLSVSFSGRNLGLSELADKWEKLAKFDYEEMGMDIINYQCEWDRYFYGVGIRAISSFDRVTQTPKAKHLCPSSWLPDPKGKIDPNGFRWHGFEVEYSRDL